MSDSLTTDELDALEQISRGIKGVRVSACIARNSKRLNGLKLIAAGKNGQLAITEKGKQTLFVNRCIKGLRAIGDDPQALLDPDVAMFLGKKGHIVPIESSGGFAITQKGRESLADIASTALPNAAKRMKV